MNFLIVDPASVSLPHRALLVSRACQACSSHSDILVSLLQGPDTVLEFMGIILDSEKMEARLPTDKVERIQISLASCKCRKSSTLKELQSLLGTFNLRAELYPKVDPSYNVWLSLPVRSPNPTTTLS